MGGLGSRQRVSASLQIFALTAKGNVPGVEGNFSGWELSGENMSEGGMSRRNIVHSLALPTQEG